MKNFADFKKFISYLQNLYEIIYLPRSCFNFSESDDELILITTFDCFLPPFLLNGVQIHQNK